MRKAILFLAVLVFVVPGVFAGGGGQRATTPVPGARRDIMFWDMVKGPPDAYNEALDGLLAKFNAENRENINVAFQTYSSSEGQARYLTAVNSNTEPDVSSGFFTHPYQFADMGIALPLDSIIDQWRRENSIVLRDISQSWMDLFKYDGKQYAIPLCVDSRMMFYRTDMFEMAGITQLPKTWAELEEICAKLKAVLPSDVYPLIFPGGGTGGVTSGIHTLLAYLISNDVGCLDVNGQPDFLNPKVTEMLQFMNRLWEKGYVPEGVGAYGSSDARRIYQAGKAAMYQYTVLDLRESPELDKLTAVMPPFAGPSGKSQYLVWINSILGFNTSKDTDAALKFIKWFMENNLPLWTEGLTFNAPARASFFDDPFFSLDNQRKQILPLLPACVPVTYPSPRIDLAFTVIDGEALPMEALVNSFVRNPNYQEIQRTVQDKLTNALRQMERR